ncbi:MarR family transcriptional regulator [Streptomyces sp. NPDC047315]|uniref:MarR family winged helix-turn-helix transcriptional regulator n=1 Tax=Streptomyces sp. NPDC047315 TaxID=3155142 RepID=UPI0033D2EF84
MTAPDPDLAPDLASEPAPVTDAEAAGRLRAALQHLAPVLRGDQRTHPDLTPSRLAALGVLAEHSPLRIGELAARMGISLSTTSRMVDLLAASGWIDRRSDPADQRASLIGLSADGSAVLHAARRDTTSALCRAITRLPPDARRRLREALPALESLGRPRAEHPPG